GRADRAGGPASRGGGAVCPRGRRALTGGFDLLARDTGIGPRRHALWNARVRDQGLQRVLAEFWTADRGVTARRCRLFDLDLHRRRLDRSDAELRRTLVTRHGRGQRVVAGRKTQLRLTLALDDTDVLDHHRF